MMNRENSDFDEQRYFWDTFKNSEEIDPLIKAEIPSFLSEPKYSSSEFAALESLKKKSLPLVSEEIPIHLYLQTIGVLAGSLYDMAVFGEEGSCESGWNINTLSPVLTCFYDYRDTVDINSETLLTEAIERTLLLSLRRMLIYPLYRSYDLAMKVLRNTAELLKDKQTLLKTLLLVKKHFDSNEPRFILSQIYLDDLIIWVQLSNKSVWDCLKLEIEAFKPSKKQVELDLDRIDNDYE